VAPAVGFIGFGEAGSTIARGLRAAGIDTLSAFDIKTHTAIMAEATARRQGLERAARFAFTVWPRGAPDISGRARRDRRGHQPRIFANMSGAQIVASDSMM
jgi:hypothetical protein